MTSSLPFFPSAQGLPGALVNTSLVSITRLMCWKSWFLTTGLRQQPCYCRTVYDRLRLEYVSTIETLGYGGSVNPACDSAAAVGDNWNQWWAEPFDSYGFLPKRIDRSIRT